MLAGCDDDEVAFSGFHVERNEGRGECGWLASCRTASTHTVHRRNVRLTVLYVHIYRDYNGAVLIININSKRNIDIVF